ncbi:lipase family protein [Nonlabens ulvanivorans]|uniref:DUF676 domain-containing protein n=1 Tax=Nonlabens ulvanivorans TaxID=906888 RepID=A0A084JUV3_NONUL|nr:hypothetical protein [Nonlabens ulvanivorans]KEZ92737.1 hypothetical protein IL45_11400 [Nonlabens ulvanivorans]PRX15584.1 hypothetical protein LY02_00804 [Nonlabens ulvanivorans]
MKRFILSIGMLLFLYNATAQESEPTLDDALENVDQTDVTSGIIYERVFQFANLYNFNREEGFDTATYDYFQKALSEIHRASNEQLFMSRSSLLSQIKQENTGIVPLGILNTDFQLLNYREEDIENSGLTYDEEANEFTQISGRPAFYTLHTTVIAPLDQAVKGSGITFKIDPAYIFENQQQRIKKLTADFGDGITREIISDFQLQSQQITVNFNSDGDKIATYEITYEDDSSINTQSSIYFKYEPTVVPKGLTPFCAGATFKENGTIIADETFTGYAAGDPTIKAEIEYRIFFSQNDGGNNQLDNPIIILDGFDPGDKRKIEDCDCEQDEDCVEANKENGQFNRALHDSMYDFQTYYDENNIEQNALMTLREQGFDVIMVNHPTYETTDLSTGQTVTIDGGAYYIESNALALIKLIKQTNGIARGINPDATLKIIGPSMGGQISRYALAYMEHKEEVTGNSALWDHNVSHWVSVDSPHLGANIPLGDQALIYLLRNQSPSASDFYYNQLGSPAALQQLIEQHRSPIPAFGYSGLPYPDESQVIDELLDARTILQGFNEDRGSSYFQTHYNNQNVNGVSGSNGFPVKSINLSLINGSLSGSKLTDLQTQQGQLTYANDGEKVLGIKTFARVRINLPLGNIVFRTHIATLDSHFMPSNGNSNRIAKFYKIPQNHITSATNSNDRGVMDNVPGGYFGAQQDLADAVLDGDNPVSLDTRFPSGTFMDDILGWTSNIFGVSVLGDVQVRKNNPVHSFIPSFSAMAHLNPDQNWNNPLDYNLTCDSNVLTPFDSYYGEDLNTRHTSFNNNSVQWLIANLAVTDVNNILKPEYPVDINDLLGPSEICVGETVTFSFENPCKLLDASFFYSSGGLNVISHTNGSVTVTGTDDGPAEIILRRANGETLRKPIYVGAPQAGGTLLEVDPSLLLSLSFNSNTLSYCTTTGVKIIDWPNLEQVDNIEMRKITGQSDWDGEFRSGRDLTAVIYSNCNEVFEFEVRAENECGWSDWEYFNVDITGCTSNCPPPSNTTNMVTNNFVISPVPADTDLAIDMIQDPEWTFYTLGCSDGITDLDGNTNCPTYVGVKLYDFSGTLVLNKPAHQLGSAIDVSALVPGTYVMHITHAGLLETCQIPIN